MQKLTKMHKNFFKAANSSISLLAYLSKILTMLFTPQFDNFGLIQNFGQNFCQNFWAKFLPEFLVEIGGISHRK